MKDSFEDEEPGLPAYPDHCGLTCCAIEDSSIFRTAKDQGTKFEFTVVQKSNHCSFPKSGCNRFRGSFFVTFLKKQKSKRQHIEIFPEILNLSLIIQ